MFIHERERQVPVYGEYDVAVVGGGIAGIAAALAAARKGAKTILLEKMFLLGGLATGGLVTIYLPLCDGRGQQVSFGIAEELLRLSAKHGCEVGCAAWLEGGTEEEKKKKRFEVQFNANLFAILCEQLLLENGVEILYGTGVCGCVTEGEKIRAVFIENKSGRQAVLSKSFVDASGDADLCFTAGADMVEFQQGNVLASWCYEHTGDRYRLHMLGFADIPDRYKTEQDKNKTEKRYRGLDGKELSDMTVESHRNLAAAFLENGGITPTHALATIATIPQIRMTRRIDGVYTLDDSEQHRFFSDSIGMIADWRKAGPVYEIPFRTLYGAKRNNLITAGRCISVTDPMWDISRVIPACAVTGQAAGTAAAMTDRFGEMDIAALQKELATDGVKLHEDRGAENGR